MQILIIGFALLVLVLIIGRAFTRANPQSLAKSLKQAAGITLLVISVFLIATGKVILGIPLAFFAFSLLGYSFPWQTGAGNTRKKEGQRSSVRTDMLEMTLDHDTGEMIGVVRRGQFSGRKLADLSANELNVLLQEAYEQDAQAAQLLEAYISRFGDAANGGSGQSSRGGGPAPNAGPMTLAEAYAVLGLEPGADREAVLQAHRGLMKKYHPDHGGTTYLATKINEAKDILLRHVG
jgi:hypothetical protein